jgi:hypothetical protein
VTPPWLADRRYYRPDARHSAGLTYDDIAPTEADDRELKRSLRAVDKRYEAMYRLGLTSKRCPRDADRWETAAWWAGRYERNRRRQDAVVSLLKSLLGRRA